jgi:hypothetical protein
MERIKSILNNDKVGNAFFNLYDRWRDESEYEDINDYGKAIFNTINSQIWFKCEIISKTSTIISNE